MTLMPNNKSSDQQFDRYSEARFAAVVNKNG
jgi:hypothetical protein